MTRYLTFIILLLSLSCSKNGDKETPTIKVIGVYANTTPLNNDDVIPIKSNIILEFEKPVIALPHYFIITNKKSKEVLNFNISILNNGKNISLNVSNIFDENTPYTLETTDKLLSINNENVEKLVLNFTTERSALEITNIRINEVPLILGKLNTNLSRKPIIDIFFNEKISMTQQNNAIVVVGKKNYPYNVKNVAENHLQLELNEELQGYEKFNVLITESFSSFAGFRPFKTVSYACITGEDSNPKFPIISDSDLLDLVQKQTFKYFWDFGHPASGMARERNTSGNLVTVGGSGFGIMAMIVAVERKFITKNEAIIRWEKIITFLEKADKFQGVWPHWLDGNTGKVIPFSTRDNGGDLVETSFMIQGLLTLRQYLDANDEIQNKLIDRINILWSGVEWTFYQNEKNVLYWHWSPQYQWAMNLPIQGYNETLITYILAAASPTYAIQENVYHQGFARNGNMTNKRSYYGYTLPLGTDFGGPLFFSHYSFLGLDPRNLSDIYGNYWIQGKNHALIHYEYCKANPKQHVGYSDKCWGLTASDNPNGYNAHSPTNDLGVISPTAALSSFPYTPNESMKALHYFYYILGDKLWGEYGFFDAFHLGDGWTAKSYLAIDQGPIICMIENQRSGLLWDLFMSAPEVKVGLNKLQFKF